MLSLVGGASAQTAGPSGNSDAPDISQASSNDLNVEFEIRIFLDPYLCFVKSKSNGRYLTTTLHTVCNVKVSSKLTEPAAGSFYTV